MQQTSGVDHAGNHLRLGTRLHGDQPGARGGLWVHLHGLAQALPVSRAHRGRFRGM